MRADAALGWGLAMRPVPFFLALCIALAPPPLRAQESGRFDHFIDFRARPGAMWGHTFILYGRVDERGKPVELVRAGLYPDDGRAGLMLGTVVPVRAAVRAVPGDFSETPSAIYRRTLSSAQYARLKATVARIRATDHGWHMLMHNCNHFADRVAQSLGLYTPPNILVPNAWVRALKAMNER
jgi:hypothetical protein